MKFSAGGVVATLVALAVSPADAGLNCGMSNVDVGDSRGGVTSTYIAHNPDRTWVIKHTLVNGTVIDRSLQYAVTDATDASKTQWRGVLARNPNLLMVGEVMQLRSNGQPTYNEWLYDTAQGGRLLMHSVALCTFDGASATPPPTAQPSANSAPATVAARAGEDSVGIISNGRVAVVQVGLGDAAPAVPMLIDTGATEMSVTNTLADELLAKGDAEATSDGTYTLANGQTDQARRVVIHKVRVGPHVLNNMVAAVVPDSAAMLLPFPVLNLIGRFTIDTANNKLIFG
jgi:clan AA aspartic protease (TIGR02281 family)